MYEYNTLKYHFPKCSAHTLGHHSTVLLCTYDLPITCGSYFADGSQQPCHGLFGCFI